MRYVTVSMLAEHAKKHRATVIDAIKRAKVPAEQFPGCKGLRITEREANKFLLRQWPESGPLPAFTQTVQPIA